MKQEQHVLETREALDELKKWFERRSAYEFHTIVKGYDEICRIGTVWREYFSCKGIYKTVRRHYIRHMVQFLEAYPLTRRELPQNIAREILDKFNQRWLPNNAEVIELTDYLFFQRHMW